MKRVYTDERFPGVEVHNDGSPRFVVVVDGREEDVFTTFKGQGVIPEEQAQARAQAYFDRMAHGQMSDELLDRGEGGLSTAAAPSGTKHVQLPDEDDTDVFNNPPPPRGQVDLGDTVTSDDILDLYQRAKDARDPKERERLMQQVRSMSGQLESEAGELVNRLLA